MFKRLSSQFIKGTHTNRDSMQLIISEKPAAAEKIAAALGKSTKKVLNKVAYFEIPDKDIIVVPAVGHLFTLAQKEKTWKYPVFDLEWKPTYETEKAAFA
jgi:DNA topoisomerase-1